MCFFKQVTLVVGVLFFVLAVSTMASSQGLRVRRDYTTLEAPDRQDFVDAVIALKAKAEYDPLPCDQACTGNGIPDACCAGAGTGTCGTCDYTNTYDKFVFWHMSCGCGVGLGNDDQHSNPGFLVWHRELLRRFELELRTVTGAENVTIPYWDWRKDFPSHKTAADNLFMGGPGGVNSVVTTGPFAHATGDWEILVAPVPVETECVAAGNPFACCTGPLAGPTCMTLEPEKLKRNATLAGKAATTPQLIDTLQTTPYDSDPWDHTVPLDQSFRNHLESRHNVAHGFVGGNMGFAYSSTNDPVFWLHHAFVDCLYAEWQAEHPGIDLYLPKNGELPGVNLDEKMSPWDEKTPEDVLDINALGYEYDTLLHVIPVLSPGGVAAFGLLLVTGIYLAIRRRGLRGDST